MCASASGLNSNGGIPFQESEFFADAKAFVLRQRPPTPDPKIRRQKYAVELSTQIKAREKKEELKKREEEEAERTRRRMLTEDLALEREEFLRRKSEGKKRNDEALRTQLADRLERLVVPVVTTTTATTTTEQNRNSN